MTTESSVAEPGEIGLAGPPPVPPEKIPESEHTTLIMARPGWRMLDWREMWRFRELLYFLTLRDIQIRHKQALLGVVWVILQPLMYMVVLSFVFYRMAHAPTDGLPYPLFVFSGLTLWMFFSTAVTQAGNSVVGSEALITKVYFPRLTIPFAAVGAALFDFAIMFIALIAMILYYVLFTRDGHNISFTWQLLLLLPIIALAALAGMGIGTLVAALNVSYRDFKYTIPVLVQLWMFATPAIFWGEYTAADQAAETSGGAKAAAVDQAADASRSIHSTSKDEHKSAPRKMPEAAKPAHGLGKPDATGQSTPETKSAEHKENESKPLAEQKPPDVPAWVKQALKFNPMTGLVRSFRAALLGKPIPWNHLGYSAFIVVLTFITACFYFHRVEDNFADII